MDLVFNLMFWISILAFTGSLIAAAVSDFRTLTIPNWCSVTGAVAFLPYSITIDMPLTVVLLHYGTGLALLFIGAILFSLGVIGSGDTKLLASASIWMGSEKVADFILLVAVLGGVLAMFTLCYRIIGPENARQRAPIWLKPSASKNNGIPYGIAITLAGLIMISKSGMV